MDLATMALLKNYRA